MSDFYINDSEYCLADEYFYSLPEKISDLKNDNTEFDQCFLEDYQVITKIQEAEKRVSNGSSSYAYYKLISEDYYLNLFEQLTIEKAFESYYELFDIKLRGLQEGVAKYLRSLSDDGKNDNIAGDIAKEVTKGISNILNSSGYNNIYVFMISYMGRPLGNDIKWEEEAWHIDKSLRGVINAVEDLYARELRYLFTIYGNSTYYYDDNTKEGHQEFLNNTYGHGEAYYCQKNTFCKFEDILEKEKITFAPKGYGSVHIAGKEYGSIHGFPKLHKKVLAIIIPEEHEVLEDHRKHTEQNNYAE